ncbi:type I-E CRISPR-associated protein Cse2/CasB [Methylomonas montana]|uniref:type I-E CRISPR-associated protein Cse2/CasB n=1 Tax=Methylomonas montana TaxID=3058963 RepID=UPI002658B310|nr:type I-E CRISPR-associated protein Cse2/CasB [Methylomonas montana]WKJ90933.1 type I-E CRISPR-associated protein Cse2/CasB [Methylomonas montana]
MSQQTEEDRQQFLQTLYSEYQGLSNGDKAGIRRTIEPDDLLLNPAFYHLLQATLGQFQAAELTKARDFFKNLSQVARLVYLLPFVSHEPQGKHFGAVLRELEISERRLFLVMRSEYPQDLIQLRRLLKQSKEHKIDGIDFGELLYYWGTNKKRQLMKDYYLPSGKTPSEETMENVLDVPE